MNASINCIKVFKYLWCAKYFEATMSFYGDVFLDGMK